MEVRLRNPIYEGHSNRLQNSVTSPPPPHGREGGGWDRVVTFNTKYFSQDVKV